MYASIGIQRWLSKSFSTVRVYLAPKMVTIGCTLDQSTASNTLNSANYAKLELKLSSSNQIRTRLLLNLGVAACPRTASIEGPCQRASSRPTLVTGCSFVEPLKYDRQFDVAPDNYSPTSSVLLIGSPVQSFPAMKKHRKSKSAITFDDSVRVLPIPHHEAYSDRLRSRMWSDRYELMSNVRRNTIEFAAEGWDWRNVFEDEMLHLCPETGELVHPVHRRSSDSRRLIRGSSIMEGKI